MVVVGVSRYAGVAVVYIFGWSSGEIWAREIILNRKF